MTSDGIALRRSACVASDRPDRGIAMGGAVRSGTDRPSRFPSQAWGGGVPHVRLQRAGVAPGILVTNFLTPRRLT
jgi:hypothetical protein